MYYYEEYRVNHWSARTQSDLPRDRGGEGEKKNIRGVVEINPSHEHLTLDQLREIYSPDGTLQATGKTSSAPEPLKPETYQARVWSWVVMCFGNEVAFNKEERCDRFLEEVLELLQSLGYDPARVDALKGYVWSRDIGEPEQETGGVMVTLSALLSAHEIDMRACAEKELDRVWGKIEKIRAKQAAKPVGSALPQAWSPRLEPASVEAPAQLAERKAEDLHETARRVLAPLKVVMEDGKLPVLHYVDVVDRVAEIFAEVRSLQAELRLERVLKHSFSDQMAQLGDRLKKACDALEWYGDSQNWWMYLGDDKTISHGPANDDAGALARNTLNSFKN